jgi:hypothetical protein
MAFLPGTILSVDTKYHEPAANSADETVKAKALEVYGGMPLLFIENQGQLDSAVRYYMQAAGQTVYLTDDGIVFDLIQYQDEVADVSDLSERQAEILAFSLDFVNANESPVIQGMARSKAAVNYFIGSDPDQWHTGIPCYKEVLYRNIYPGIDLRLYGNAGSMQYDFIVGPGADVSDISLAYGGIDSLNMLDGQLVAGTALGDIKQSRPYIYQRIGGKEVAVDGAFVLASTNTYGFEVSNYNIDYPLIIDPSLLYSTYLGGAYNDFGFAIAADSSGCAYVTGGTYSTNFPNRNAYQTAGDGDMMHAFITKIDTIKSGDDSLIYSTYFGGSGHEWGTGIAVDPAGCAYIAGLTNSIDLPVLNAYQGAAAGGQCDAFVTKLNAVGNALVYSTYLGGSINDVAVGIALDANQCAYVAGFTSSIDFPTLNAYQATHHGKCDAFVTKLNASGNALIYSTYLGGSATDSAAGIAVDSSRCAYITGVTTSADFPVQNPFQMGQGGADVFITKLNASGNVLVYSTYLGGSGYDGFHGIAAAIFGGISVDAAGCAYVAGLTTSTDFPTHNAYSETLHGSRDAFVTRLNSSGAALDYSTYLGGNDRDWARDVAVDSTGNSYVVGSTISEDFPTVSPIQGWNIDTDGDAFVSKIDTTASGTPSLVFSTYLGTASWDSGHAVDVDPSGYAYVVGLATSPGFPTANGYQPTRPASTLSQFDSFVAKIDTTAVNGIPYIPSDPSPEYWVTAVSENTTLSWTGGDPDAGDNVTYDVYLAPAAAPWWELPLVSHAQIGTTYDPPGNLFPYMRYCWRVVARDNHGAQSFGPHWLFFTTTIPPRATTEDVINIEAEGTSENATFRSTLNGNLISLGSCSSAKVRFYYNIAPVEGIGTTSSTTEYQTLDKTGPFSIGIGGLQAGTIYSYRVEVVPVIPPYWYMSSWGAGKNFTTGVATMTGTGAASFLSNSGSVTKAAAVDESTLPLTGKPNVTFPHGLFEFTISDILPGSTVMVTLELPSPVPQGSEYWKYDEVNGWTDVTSLMGDDDGDNILTVTLTDGGLGDSDGMANGVIVDPGGPGVPAAVPAPTITSVDPAYGIQGQTFDVILTGTNFTDASSVSFGALGSYVSVNGFTVDSDTQITANITIASYASPGTRNVDVVTPGGTGTLTDGFTVNRAGEQTQSTNTATGTGVATFTTNGGSITGLTAFNYTPCGIKPSLSFLNGFFSFNITNITPGSTVTITITLPINMPTNTQYWKCINEQWVDITSLLGDNDGDNVLTLTLSDGGLGDADGAANGTIVDPGGPAIPGQAVPSPAAHQVSPTPPRLLNPAQVSVKYLSVSPQQASVNQPVTITTNVVNTGDQPGSLNVALRINGQVEETRMISVGPQASQPVKFTVSRSEPGTYSIDIYDQSGSFIVNGVGSKSVNSGVVVLIAMLILVLTATVLLVMKFWTA